MAITWDFSGSVQILCHGGRPAGLHRIAGSLPRNRMDAPDSHAQGPDSASPSNYSDQSLQEYHSGQSHGQNR